MADPINPMIPNIGNTEQAIAGSKAAIFTNTDRKIIKERSGEIDMSMKFTDLVKGMFNITDSIDNVSIGEKQDEEQEQDQRKRIKLERRLIKFAPISGPVKDRIEVTDLTPRTPANDRFVQKIENPFDEYAVLYGHTLLGIEVPKDRIKYLEETIPRETILAIREQVHSKLSEFLAMIIREGFYQRSSDPKFATNILLKSKYAPFLLDYYANKHILPIPILLEIAKELGLTIDHIKEYYNLETVSLSNDVLKIQLLEEARHNEIKILEESLKDNYVKMLLIGNSAERGKLSAIVDSTKSKLLSMNVPKENVLAVIEDAKRIAWLRAVVLVKDLHLKRVFSNSKKDFEELSSKIKDYTLRTRRLGLKVSREGVLWVEAQIEKMALETAEYKLNLLNSMQKMGFDKDREKDIHWLKSIIPHLKKS